MRLLPIVVFFLCTLTATAQQQTSTAASDTSKELSILTWNVKMLPRIANLFLHHRPVWRAKLIPDEVLREKPDVVVFQEMYSNVANRIFKKKLKEMYPYSQGFQNKKAVTYKRAGGVIIFSKYPMKEVESIRYTWLEGIDKKAGKGALLVEVQHPTGKIQVLGTHMEAGGSRELKISQYEDAGKLLRKHQQAGVPQFACGDFNTRLADTILYPKLLAALQMEDGEICTELKCTSDHLLNDMDSYNPEKRHLIDFVFFKGNGQKLVAPARSVLRFEKQWHKNHKDLSDHFAVMLRTRIEKDATAAQ